MVDNPDPPFQRIPTFIFLGTNVAHCDFSWTTNTTESVKRAQHQDYFLKMLRKEQISGEAACPTTSNSYITV